MALLIVISGNPAMAYFPKEALYPAALGLMVVAWFSRGRRLTTRDKLIVGAFIALSAVHVVTFGADVATSSIGFLVRLLVALFAVRAFADFEERYVDVMWAFTLMSFVFHLPVLLGVDMAQLTQPTWVKIESLTSRHIWLHNYMIPGEEARNAGMFGEPGMNAGYIALALLFGATGWVRRGKRTWVVLALGVVSTLSTTGYAAGAAIAFIAALNTRGRNRYSVVIQVTTALALFLFGGAFAYREVEFLGDKIEHQLGEASEGTRGAKTNRFGNFLYDMEHLAERPLTGWSPLPRTRSAIDSEVEELATGQGNGLSNFAVKFGVLGIGLFFASVYKRFRRRRVRAFAAAGACLIIAMLLTGEPYLNQPLFMGLMFLSSRRERLVRRVLAPGSPGQGLPVERTPAPG